MNKVAEEISGWQEEEVINKPFEQIFRLYSEETGKKVENPVEKVLQTGKIVGLANHTVLITKDGRQVPIADSAAPIRNEKAKLLSSDGIPGCCPGKRMAGKNPLS